MTVRVISTYSGAAVREVRSVPGSMPVRFDGLLPGQVYRIQVFPTRHRAVQVFGEPQAEVTVYAPLRPDKVRSYAFPAYEALDVCLKAVLERSSIEGQSGAALYDGLTNEQRAGLLNLFAKMQAVAVAGWRAWSFVTALQRISGDRIWAAVDKQMHRAVALMTIVPGRLHRAPAGFTRVVSVKTPEPYGNLQLTLFANALDEWMVDADIDDSAGIGHAFQVIGNALTGEPTHPVDVHQILVFQQQAQLPYDVA